MSDRIVLQPCKVRGSQFVADRKVTPLELDWPGLLQKLCPSGERFDGMKLRSIRSGAFIGLSKGAITGKVVNFLMINEDRSGSIEAILKKDPSFETRVLEVYRVESVAWAGRVEETIP